MQVAERMRDMAGLFGLSSLGHPSIDEYQMSLYAAEQRRLMATSGYAAEAIREALGMRKEPESNNILLLLED
jgi:hypothetical protein